MRTPDSPSSEAPGDGPCLHSSGDAVVSLVELLACQSRTFLHSAARLIGACPHHETPADCPRHNRPSHRCESALSEAIFAVVEFAETHFAAEERMMRAAGLDRMRELWASHTEDHAEFMARLHKIAERVDRAPACELTASAVNLIEGFWLNHHVDHDQAALAALKQRRNPPSS